MSTPGTKAAKFLRDLAGQLDGAERRPNGIQDGAPIVCLPISLAGEWHDGLKRAAVLIESLEEHFALFRRGEPDLVEDETPKP